MSDGFSTAVAAVTNTLFLLGSIYIYLWLAKQIAARRDEFSTETRVDFGLPDVVLALVLATLFALNAATSAQSGKVVLHTNDLIANALISAGLFLFVAAFLKLRGRDVGLLAGFSKLSFSRTLTTGFVLLFAAYPLIFVADLVTQRVLGRSSSKQGIVELFSDSQTLKQRV
ncbi:MAG: hypothetical protein M3Y03_00955, partial [Verrucomicrobiota bacterium]|nr:hypothetical protein [Verrucomicrobiota bacterium]